MFNILRTQGFSKEAMEYFEKCKEERIGSGSAAKVDLFARTISNASLLDVESLSNKAFFLGFLGYIVVAQLRYAIVISRSIVENTLRTLSGEDHSLKPFTGQIPVEALRAQIQETIQRISKRQQMILRYASNVGEGLD